MDTHPHMNGVTTLERVQNREEFRNLLADVGHLPETQRSALLLREIDAMSYEEIAQAMDTTVPGVKCLLVRARIALAESSQARQLTCDEVRLELAEAAEGLAKVSGPARRHVKACEPCREFRSQLRTDTKVLAALFPAGPLLALKGALVGQAQRPLRRRWRRSRCRRERRGWRGGRRGRGSRCRCGRSRGGRRWCRSGRCRGRSRCGSCRSWRCGGREHGCDRRCRGSRRCGRRWRSRNCGRCCGRDRHQGGRRARHRGDHRRRRRRGQERLGPSSGKQAAAVEDAADPQDSTRHSGEGRTHPGGRPCRPHPRRHLQSPPPRRRRSRHGPARDDRSDGLDRLADRRHRLPPRRGKHKRHKQAVANSDSPARRLRPRPVRSPPGSSRRPATRTATAAPIRAPRAVASRAAERSSTGVQPGEVTPTPYSAPKKRKAAPKSSSKSSPKKKVRRR